MGCQERGTDLLHLGVNGTGVDSEDVNVVAVGLDDLFGDRSRVEDHGELKPIVASQCGRVSRSCPGKLTPKVDGRLTLVLPYSSTGPNSGLFNSSTDPKWTSLLANLYQNIP
jgi:hypothetical protein